MKNVKFIFSFEGKDIGKFEDFYKIKNKVDVEYYYFFKALENNVPFIEFITKTRELLGIPSDGFGDLPIEERHKIYEKLNSNRKSWEIFEQKIENLITKFRFDEYTDFNPFIRNRTKDRNFRSCRNG